MLRKAWNLCPTDETKRVGHVSKAAGIFWSGWQHPSHTMPANQTQRIIGLERTAAKNNNNVERFAQRGRG